MTYQRFLTDNDYLALITTDLLEQIIRKDRERLAQAEARAEQVFLDYLDQLYRAHEEFAKGKCLREYSRYITYPCGAMFRKNGRIWRALATIQACHVPDDKTYWTELTDLSGVDLDAVAPYKQLRTYNAGDVVRHNDRYFYCETPHGYDYNVFSIPGTKYWEEVPAEDWAPNVQYDVHSVVSYKGEFYTVLEALADLTKDPHESDSYGNIGDYTPDYAFDATPGAYDYAVRAGKVFLPLMAPNADTLEQGTNICPDDPRNPNLVNYMASISLYYLHALISPTNISQTRADMYDQAMSWIVSASKMKLDPHLPRRMSCDGPKNPIAVADLDVEKSLRSQLDNPWFT